MKITAKHAFLLLILFLTAVNALFAQEKLSTNTTPKKDADLIIEKGLKSKFFQIKNRDPYAIVSVLKQLSSGTKGSDITINVELKTLTVRDYPENIAIIEDAIKRLDTPAAPTKNIELHMYILVGSKSAGSQQFPAELRDVVEQLKMTLSHKNYELITSIVQRLKENTPSSSGEGVLELTQPLTVNGSTSLPYLYQVNDVSLETGSTGEPVIQIGNFFFTTNDRNVVKMQTPLSLKAGEKVVVGTATVYDKSFIVVIVPKLLN